MDYARDILNRLLDIYERREAYARDEGKVRAIQFDVKKAYPAYADRYDHVRYREIDAAVERLRADGCIIAGKDGSGRYSKIKLVVSSVDACYAKLGRRSIPERCGLVRQAIAPYLDSGCPLVRSLAGEWTAAADACKKLPYDLKYDHERAAEVLRVLEAILKLDKETYIRNFSTALFHDSKRFQREYKAITESVLFDNTDNVVEKERVLEYYNLYENPTYVLIKGNALICFDTSVIDAAELPDGIALSNASLERIRSVTVRAPRLITVENLTTFHDSDEADAVHLYLGGYHNSSKQALLEKIYAENKNCAYFHKGDIDVYGFLILENLKEKTGIPFEPLGMDLATLERFYRAGFVKPLSAADRKAIIEKIDGRLSAYSDVLRFMLDRDCKAEQESFKALELV